MKHNLLALLACCALPLAAAQTAPAQTTPASKAKNLRLNVYFQSVDAKGQLILKYGDSLLTTRLHHIRLRDGSGGVLGLIVPRGVMLQAEIIEKGNIPSVVLWKGPLNLNEQLLMQGVAEGAH